MGITLDALGRAEEAAVSFRKAAGLHANFFEAYYNLGSVELKLHRLNEAIDALQNAVRVRPAYYQAHEELGFAFYLRGNTVEALTHLRLALDGEPERVSVLTLAASLMAMSPEATVRNGPEAVVLAERAVQLTKGLDVSALDTLAAAYAEDGRFDRAQETVRQAMAIVEKQTKEEQGDASLMDRLKTHLAKYEASEALRTPPDDGTL
jgi:tetratricopeptide (TPR) repeat protein